MACLTGHAARLTQFTDGLAQRRVAFGQPVLERIVKAFAHHLLHRQLQPFGIKKLRRRNTATERNHAGQFTVLEEFADGGRFEFPRARGESPIVHILFLFCLVVFTADFLYVGLISEAPSGNPTQIAGWRLRLIRPTIFYL